MNAKTYPRTNDSQTIYLNTVIRNPNITVGDYTIYNDFVNDPTLFEKNNVLYHYPINGDRLIIGKFCSIACGAKFLFNSANHSLKSLSGYTFPLFFEEWDLDKKDVASAWDNKGGHRYRQRCMDRLRSRHHGRRTHRRRSHHRFPGSRNQRRASLYNCRRHSGKRNTSAFRPGDHPPVAKLTMVGLGS